jgi:hypothetical protein
LNPNDGDSAAEQAVAVDRAPLRCARQLNRAVSRQTQRKKAILEKFHDN